MPNISLEISTLIGKLKTTQKRRENPVAIITALDKVSKKELWKISKDYSSLLAFDNSVRKLVKISDFPKLPEQSLFQSHAPSKVDTRRIGLENYFAKLFSIEKLPLSAGQSLCEFLSSNIIDPMDISDIPSRREGYLTKRGKKTRGWKVRYFAIENDVLNYYDKPGGELQGTINLIGAKIGRQTKTETDLNPSEDSLEKEFRHAFLLVEPKKRDQLRHVLCAESDQDRDLWIDALLQIIAQPVGTPSVASPTQPTPSSSSAPTLKGLATGLDPESGPPSYKEVLATDNRSPSMHSMPSSSSVPLYTEPPPISKQRRNLRHSFAAPSLLESNNLPASASTTLVIQRPKFDSKLDPINPELRQTVSLDEELENTKDVKKVKKKGFFASLRNRGANHIQGHLYSPSASLQSLSDSFQATPYSAVEQKSLPTIHAGIVNSNPSKHDAAALQALGASIEEAMASQNELHMASSPPNYSVTEMGGYGNVRRVFGVPLADALALASKNVHQCRVPAIVYRCIELLKVRGGIFEEGIFRLSGSTSTIRTLKERFNTEYDVDLVHSETQYDVHAVAGLLKLFLREIPATILSTNLATEFRDAVDISDPKTRAQALQALVNSLPRENRDLLCVLCSLLTEIISHSEVNKMNLRNVGIMFAPTLNITASVLIYFLTDFDDIFGEPPNSSSEDLAKPSPSQTPAGLPIAIVNANARGSEQVHEPAQAVATASPAVSTFGSLAASTEDPPHAK